MALIIINTWYIAVSPGHTKTYYIVEIKMRSIFFGKRSLKLNFAHIEN